MAAKKTAANGNAPWVVGANYLIRTAQHHFTGTLASVHQLEIVLVDATESGKEGSTIAKCIIGRPSIIDATEIKG